MYYNKITFRVLTLLEFFELQENKNHQCEKELRIKNVAY